MSTNEGQVVGNWNYPTKVRFGPGRVRELPEACRELGMTRPLLVTDPGLAALPFVREAIQRNEDAGLPTALFSEIKGNPTGRNVSDGVAACARGRCDGVIALGGGSALDVGKAVALMVGQSRPLWDYEDIGDYWTRVDVSGMAPVVAVPTTAGTGSEVGRASVIAHEGEHHRKVIVFHPRMLPGIALCDPELTLSLPPALTAWTGVDALSHSLEAYCATGYHPLADGIALESMRLVHAWLPVAHAEPQNLEARSHLMAASLMGATAFQKGLGAMHAMSHVLGARFDAHHGLCNAIVMPYVLAFNLPAISERLERLAALLALPAHAAGGAASVVEWVLRLREGLGIPHTLEAVGMSAGDIPALAEAAANDAAAGGNPLPVDAEAFRVLFTAALDADLHLRASLR